MLDLKIMCQKLEKIRKNAKLSRRALSDISGFNERTILSYERAERLPSDRYLEFVSLYFGYTKESILNDKSDLVKLDKFVNCLLMYQSIFNYDDNKMAELLEIPKDIKILNIKDETAIEFYQRIYINNDEQRHIIDCIETAIKLKIKLSCLSNYTANDLLKTFIGKENKELYSGYNGFDDFFGLIEEGVNFSDKLNELKKTGLEITPSYYASIIKKRNNPETLTPKLITDTLPKNHKKLIDLLPYASDEFINEVIEILEKKKNLSKL
ncbi:helix-turn-helix transcriptional regulator [Campylobacter ureolyticus]|uniref:helix-turn-helix transcriptional regulator n=1 Tax=Campylobacter ureolyticus TaxID=827 RepID=UPI0022B31EDB|nr:helix-turn-helix transcriptional regulator [Campylobacter ureolyticus]MCZ6133635.1 helix-turn-helix transcriptional regulator [Campylobacter ureolyticus]